MTHGEALLSGVLGAISGALAMSVWLWVPQSTRDVITREVRLFFLGDDKR